MVKIKQKQTGEIIEVSYDEYIHTYQPTLWDVIEIKDIVDLYNHRTGEKVFQATIEKSEADIALANNHNIFSYELSKINTPIKKLALLAATTEKKKTPIPTIQKSDNVEKILEALFRLKINFNDVYVVEDGFYLLHDEFPITPRDFLKFAKKDFATDDKRGNINALTNAKRAIDCQTDTVFKAFCIDLENWNSAIVNFLSLHSHQFKNESRKHLQFLEILGIAPANLISKSRTLRNKLEHNYQVPISEDVNDAIELSELFIKAAESSLNIHSAYYIKDTSDGDLERTYNSLRVDFDRNNGEFLISEIYPNMIGESLTIKSDDILYFYFLKIMIVLDEEETLQDTIIAILQFINHPVPIKNVKVRNLY